MTRREDLVNATLLLAIVLVLLVLWLVYKVEDVAADLVTMVDMRLVELVEGDIRDAVTEVHGLRHDLGMFNDQLAQLVDHPEITLSPEIREELDAINAQAAQIDKAVTRSTDFDRNLSDRQIRAAPRYPDSDVSSGSVSVGRQLEETNNVEAEAVQA